MFAALPVELQKELRAAYDQRQRQGEHSPPQQPAGAPGKLCGLQGPAMELCGARVWLGCCRGTAWVKPSVLLVPVSSETEGGLSESQADRTWNFELSVKSAVL